VDTFLTQSVQFILMGSPLTVHRLLLCRGLGVLGLVHTTDHGRMIHGMLTSEKSVK
jgi:hypothetical protein